MTSLEENREERSEGETEEEEEEEEEEKRLPFLHGARMENDLCQECAAQVVFPIVWAGPSPSLRELRSSRDHSDQLFGSSHIASRPSLPRSSTSCSSRLHAPASSSAVCLSSPFVSCSRSQGSVTLCESCLPQSSRVMLSYLVDAWP
ncbi:unnamed protein product [Arctogadus glacialis]